MDAQAHQMHQLVPQWDLRIVCLSWAVSFLGAFSTAVTMSQANCSRHQASRIAWIFAASLCLGFGAIWSMHFVGMLAANIGVTVDFDVWLTLLSAILAVVFSFIALTTVSLIGLPAEQPRKKGHASRAAASEAAASASSASSKHNESALKQRFATLFGELPKSGRRDSKPSLASPDDTRRPLLPRYSSDTQGPAPDSRRNSLASEASAGSTADFFTESASQRRPSSVPTPQRADSPALRGGMARHSQPDGSLISPTSIATFASANTPPPPSEQHDRATPPPLLETPPAHGDSRPAKPSALRHSVTSSQTLRRSPSAQGSESTDSLVNGSSEGGTTSSSTSLTWLDHLLTPAARARIRKGDTFREETSVEYVYRRLHDGFSTVYVSSAGIFAAAVCAMHYTGMAAMQARDGHFRVEWSAAWVLISCVVAFVDCFVACVFMADMEPNIARQGAFALIASCGVTAMHYSGMKAATFYSSAPANYADAKFPAELVAAVVVCALVVSFVSQTVLAYMATLSRNRLAENVLIKRRAWRLLAQKEAAEQANALKSTFISTASHELRTPLHTVSGYSDLLSRTALSEEQRLYLETIRRACHQLTIMTRSVLDFSKLERGGEEHALPEFVNCRDCIESVAQLCTERQSALMISEQKAGDVQLVIDIDRSTPHAVYTDEVFLSRIATNLLSNALKFCPAPGFVSLHVSFSEGKLLLVVTDAGIGIPSRYLPALFEPFTQADSSLTRRHAGTGLGLAICKQLVDRLKGTITVQSKEGVGSTFTVALPIDQFQASPDAEEVAPAFKGKMAVLCEKDATSGALAAMWRRRSWDTVEKSTDDPVADFAGVARIWAEPLALEAHAELLARMSADDWSVPVFVPYSDDTCLADHAGVLAEPPVVRVRMPIVAHRLLGMLDDPEPYTARHLKQPDRPKLVRFASSTPSEATSEGATSAFSAVSGASSISAVRDEILPPMPAGPTSPSRGLHAPSDAAAKAADSLERRPSVLLVEDNSVNAKLGKRLLEVLGYDVILAANGEEAVAERLANADIQLCLMDLQMPVCDGLEATRRIRALEAEGKVQGRLPIIALTANAESREACLEAGAEDFLTKPLRLGDLEAALQRHLITGHAHHAR